jgi:gamma-glutamylcyclotransferase (GGCT)/AIG2-like uncharacterized protein YtfP
MINHTLFAYGTLRFPELIRHLIGRVPDQADAVLNGYVRFRIRHADYPGIFARPGSQVDGTVFSGITPEEWRTLDEYESDLYLRQPVTVMLTNGSRRQAQAYVLPPEHESVCTGEPWDLNDVTPPNLSE